MRFIFFWSLVLLALSMGSCAINYEIISDKEENTNFNQYKTYGILHDDHGFEVGADPSNIQKIDRAVERELEDMGYVQSENPDLQVMWFIKVDTKLEQGIYNAYYTKWRYPNALDVYEYQEGSLVIDLVDTSNGKVVWHVKASSKVTDNMPHIEDKINEVVNEIFKSYRKDTGIKKVITYAFN